MLEIISQAWGFIEPLAWLAGIISALIYWGRVKLARRKRYKNRGGKNFVVALQVGRPVSEAVKIHFGEIDCLVDVKAVLGKSQLETDRDYRLIAKDLYRAMAANQNCPIKLILSGPIGLSFLIGQLVGLAKFDVEVYQYNPVGNTYRPLPIPDRSWL